jgi:nucleoside-diphosphate-sugar epimerase
MSKTHVGLLGATSFVGEQLITLLRRDDVPVEAFSRKPQTKATFGLTWHHLADGSDNHTVRIDNWLCTAPIWMLKEHYPLLEASGARRIVALSSTSRFSKTTSSDKAEKALAARLLQGEEELQNWAAATGVDWLILRPTLIYGLGRDRNITEIARFIRRFGFFPLLGRGSGLRQPVHVEDVAQAAIAALNTPTPTNRAYTVSGGETLPYREMVGRVFAALRRPPRLLPIPFPLFRLAVAGMRLLPRYRHWSIAMAERMNSDLVFDHAEAMRDLAFSPRPFRPSQIDVAP